MPRQVFGQPVCFHVPDPGFPHSDFPEGEQGDLEPIISLPHTEHGRILLVQRDVARNTDIL